MLWNFYLLWFCLHFVENIFEIFCVGKSDFDYSTEQNTAYAIHSRHCQIIRTWLSIKVWISSTNWSTIPKYRNALVKIPALASGKVRQINLRISITNIAYALLWTLNSDKYLIAQTFIYFTRCRFRPEEYTQANFYLLLYLANDMEEDLDFKVKHHKKSLNI